MKMKAFACLVSLVVAGVASAQTLYASKLIKLNVGIVIVDSQQSGGYPSNPTPHALYNLDTNRRMLPPGFSLDNPSHPSAVDTAIFNRWTALGGSAALGTRIERRHAPYWEVLLSAMSDDAMSSFDLLILPAHGYINLNPEERERLRRFMDRGGILWVDAAPTAIIESINNLPVPFALNTSSGSGSLQADFYHPALAYPGSISAADLLAMQTTGSLGLTQVTSATLGAQEESQQWISPDYAKFVSVAEDAYGPILSVARLGDGYQVVTTRGVASALNQVPGSSNLAYTGATPVFTRQSDAAAKLFVNIAHLSSAYAQDGGGSQKSGSRTLGTRAPLLEQFRDEGESLTPFGNNAYVPPAVGYGIVAVTMSDTNHVHVYDADPKQDLDGDGDPDDGIRDYSVGTGVDKIWSGESQPDPISAPIIYEVPEENGNLRTQIAVTAADGTLLVWGAFQLDGNGKIQALTDAAPDYVVSPPNGVGTANVAAEDRGPYPPTFHEGLLYMSDVQVGSNAQGRVWVADPATQDCVRTGSSPSAGGWMVGGGGTTILPEVSGSATVGYIPISDNSGGVDKVVYIPTRPNGAFAGPNSTAGITSLWVGARGEDPVSAIDDGSFLTVATRASAQGLGVYIPQGALESAKLGVKLTILKPSVNPTDPVGDPMTLAEMQTYFTGDVSESSGILTFTRTGAALPTGFGVRVDYHIDWGTGIDALTAQIMRGQMFFPDDSNRERRILGNVALSSKGVLQVVTSTNDPTSNNGGTFWSLKEDGRGVFSVINRYDLYNQHTIVLNQTDPVTYRETFVNTDPLTTLFPPLAGTLGNLTLVSGPAVKGDTAYVVAQATKPGFVSIPYMILLAFDAAPQTRDIRTGDLQGGFTIIQPDIVRSPTKNAPELFSTLQSSQYVYERDPATDTGIIRLTSLSATTRGPIINSLSNSRPVILRRSGQPDVLIEPDANGSKWSPLQWYTVLHGYSGGSAPLVSGNTLYVAATSALPAFLTTGTFAPTSGLLTAIDPEISPNDSFLGADPLRSWQKQLYAITALTNDGTNPNFLWPQYKGATNNTELTTRVLQTTLGSSTTAYGVVGGEGLVMSWSDEGMYGFRRADVYVADEGRIGRFDGAGNPLWSLSRTTTTSESGDLGGAANERPLVRPTRVYPINDREVMIVDTGADRVLRADTAGRELRSLTEFRLDPVYTPDGYSAGSTLKLKAPRDVLYFTSEVAAADNPFDSPSTNEYWRHYLIADSGNYRLIELVDRFTYDAANGRVGDPIVDSSGQPALGVLYWHTPATYSGDKFEYSSLSRVFVTSGTPRYVVAAGLGNAMPSSSGAGVVAPSSGEDRNSQTGNGGVILFDGDDTIVINQVTVPAFTAEMWDPEGPGWVEANHPVRRKRIGSTTSVSVRNMSSVGAFQYLVMFTDSSGVYEVGQVGGEWTVQWMLPRSLAVDVAGTQKRLSVFNRLRLDNVNNPSNDNPRDFLPTYARRLESGDVIVTNGYVGRRFDGSTFGGEILQLDGDTTGASAYGFGFAKRNLGFESLSIRFNLPPITGARGILLPVFADRR